MSKVGESQGFVSRDDVEHVSPRRSVGEVLEGVTRRKPRVLVIERAGEPDDIVDAARFAQVLVQKGAGVEDTAPDSLQGLLGRSLDSIQELLGDARVATVSGTHLDHDDDASVQAAGSAYVVEHEGREIGIFFGEDVFSKITTRPPVFFCKNGHPNPSVGDGTCGRCPAPIVKTE